MPASYEIVITNRAERDIKKLDPPQKKRLVKALLKLKQDPLKYSEKLSDPQIGEYRFRIGMHRVIFDLDGRKIVISRVGHRSEIYR